MIDCIEGRVSELGRLKIDSQSSSFYIAVRLEKYTKSATWVKKNMCCIFCRSICIRLLLH